jgi:hypothetical protein
MSDSNDFSAIRIGTRVRYSDGTAGRIVWANAAAVKIEWNDGEKVTWKRADLGSKGLTIVDEDQDAPQAAPEEEAVEATDVQPATETEPASEATEAAPSEASAATSELHLHHGDGTSVSVPYVMAQEATSAPDQPAEVPATKKRSRRTQAAEAKSGRVSAIDAAARVLAEEGKPMGCKELIGAMAAKGYWSSPGGKTPAATLYSALLREIDTKGDAARFVKTGRGTFTLRPQA